MSPNTVAAPEEAPVTSAVVSPGHKTVVIKSKRQLVKLAASLLKNRRFRVLEGTTDIRGGGFEVNLVEEVGTDGRLVFLTGGPNLSLVGTFLQTKVDSGELK